MQTSLASPSPAPLALPASGRGLVVIIGPHLRLLHPAVLEQTARLAQLGPLRILDGGNCLDLYGLAQALRRLGGNPQQLLQRILVARGFTCYQMTSLLAQSATCSGIGDSLPAIVLDLLDTFLDENVRLAERQRLLKGCLGHLCSLSRSVPVLVTAQTSNQPGSEQLVNTLASAADQLWIPPPPQPSTAQLRLFA